MSGGIFLSYRRDDSRHAAGRLADHLTKTFGRDQLFMDVDTIDLGADFVDVVSTKVANCNVLLAVIGANWLQPRLDDPNDFVHIEIAAALKRNIPVIPVLVDGAQLPKAEELPEPLRPLVRRQATRLTHERFGTDTLGLVEALQRLVRTTPPSHKGLFGLFGRGRGAVQQTRSSSLKSPTNDDDPRAVPVVPTTTGLPDGAPTRRKVAPSSQRVLVRITLGFIAAVISVLVAHEGLVFMFNAAGFISVQGWSMTPPIPPWGVPRLINNIFWGGLWGVLFGLLYDWVPGAMAWLKGLIFGLFIVLVSNWTLLPLIRGQIFGQPNQVLFNDFVPIRMLIVVTIVSGFGLGLGIIYGLIAPIRDKS